jgi:rare lipoprotein A
MAGQLVGRACWRRVLAAGLLAVLVGCAAPPPVPTAPPLAPLSTLTPAQAISAAPVAKVVLPGEPSRLSALARRFLDKFRRAPAPVAEPTPPPADEAGIDEKYRFTGDAALELERGHASWYGGRFDGRLTASGETYDKYALTAAHRTLPFGTIVRVRSLALGREVDVRINDRGPFAPGRVIDLSQAAAEALGLMGAGVSEVSLNVAESVQKEAEARQPQRRSRKAASPKSGKSGKSHTKSSSKSEKHSAKASPKRSAGKKH